MTSLVDIAPSTRTVPVDGTSVSVYGVSAAGIGSLLAEFPELQNLFLGGEKVEITPALILKEAPKAIAAIIAAGTGSPGDPKAIEVASRLSAAVQLDFLNEIVDLTMPRGFGPFADALNTFMVRMNVNTGDLGTGQGTKSQ